MLLIAEKYLMNICLDNYAVTIYIDEYFLYKCLMIYINLENKFFRLTQPTVQPQE